MPDLPPVETSVCVRLFRDGSGETILVIPREFELKSEEVRIRKDGERLVLEPFHRKSLGEILDSFNGDLNEDFEPVDDQPPDPIDV
jgi:antitoxin VapB